MPLASACKDTGFITGLPCDGATVVGCVRHVLIKFVQNRELKTTKYLRCCASLVFLSCMLYVADVCCVSIIALLHYTVKMVLTRTDIDDIKRIISTEISATITEQLKMQIADAIFKKIEVKFGKSLKELEDRSLGMEKAISELQEENIRLQNILDRQEQFSRGRNLRIFGMAADNDNNLPEAVVKLFTHEMKVNGLRVSDIKRCHRIRSKNPSPNKPPAVLVELANVNIRSMVLKNRSLLKSTGISVKEDITQCRLSLLKSAVNKFTSKNAWCLHGIIYVKSADGKVHRVDNQQHLDRISNII